MTTDNSPIIIETEDAQKASGDPTKLKGVKIINSEEIDGKTVVFKASIPEFGPARWYQDGTQIHRKGIVVEIHGRRYRVRYHNTPQNGGGGYPDGATVEFIPTTDPETPWTSAIPKRQGPYLTMFGQPSFIQWPYFPDHNGTCAYHLLTIESNWGDSGNQNCLIGLDEAGVPQKAWHEASCS